ncbi:MAG: methyltransferase domain-containing protein [Thermoanaerobaculia bacterium]
MTIDYFFAGNESLRRFRTHFAVRARQRMQERFYEFAKPGPESKVLDLGVTPDVSLPESNYFLQAYPYPERVTATSIENLDEVKKRFPKTRFLTFPPGRLPFADREFDFLFCSAVLEHVGSEERQREFVAECFRVSRKVFLTTPNRYFPIEIHTFIPFLHWLPKEVHRRCLRLFGMTMWAREDHLNLLSFSDLKVLVPENCRAEITAVNTAGFPSNLILFGYSS